MSVEVPRETRPVLELQKATCKSPASGQRFGLTKPCALPWDAWRVGHAVQLHFRIQIGTRQILALRDSKDLSGTKNDYLFPVLHAAFKQNRRINKMVRA